MPGWPLSGLVLRHPNMTLGILECALDPESLSLHASQLSNTRSRRSVTQAVLQRAERARLPPDQQMPTVSIRAVPVPQPDSLMQHFDDQIALGRIAQSSFTPPRRRLFLGPFAHLDRLCVAVVYGLLLRIGQSWRPGCPRQRTPSSTGCSPRRRSIGDSVGGFREFFLGSDLLFVHRTKRICNAAPVTAGRSSGSSQELSAGAPVNDPDRRWLVREINCRVCGSLCYSPGPSRGAVLHDRTEGQERGAFR